MVSRPNCPWFSKYTVTNLLIYHGRPNDGARKKDDEAKLFFGQFGSLRITFFLNIHLFPKKSDR